MLLPPVYEWKSAVLYWDQNFFRADKIMVVYSQDLLLMKAVHYLYWSWQKKFSLQYTVPFLAVIFKIYDNF